MRTNFKDVTQMHSSTRTKSRERIPFSESPVSHMSKFNNIEERPLKINSENLSFKGFLYKPVLNEAKTAAKTFNKDEFLNITKKHLGTSAEDLFNSVKDSKLAQEMFHLNGNEVSFSKKTISHLLYDGIVYPFTVLPCDILNGAVSALKKFKPLEKWADNVYNSNTLKNMRQRSKTESKVNALRGLFETVDSLKGKSEEEISSVLFQRSIKMFDPKTGNYDTKHERSLCRVVSGVVPAFFLANDAYNLSSMCDNDPKSAEKEKKTRFRQELSRVGLNAYITLVTLGALQKYINNSKLGIMLNTALTVLFTESFARVSNGKHITRLTPEQARKVNAEKNKNDKNKEDAKYQEVFFHANKDVNKPIITKFKGGLDSTQKAQQKEPLLSYGTVMKASAVIIGAGFGIKGLRKIKFVDDAFKAATVPFVKLYKQLSTDPNFTMKKGDFDEVIKELKRNGFEVLAEKYSKVGESANKLKALDEFKGSLDKNELERFNDMFKTFQKENKDASSEKFIEYMTNPKNKLDKYSNEYKKIYSKIEEQNVIHLGSKDKKAKPAVDFVIAPFKFIFNTVKLPYTIMEKAISSFSKKPKNIQKDLTKDNVKALATSIDKMTKAAKKANLAPEQFKSFVNDNILKAFNVDNMSNISNSELANLAKTSATAATIWFLMTDNYNMVMLKSNGEDKAGAELKFKERFVQEGSRLFYQTLLIDLFNSTFRNQYNSSLWGMSWITATNTLLGEILNRKSVGMPVMSHSREELFNIEKKKEESTGVARAYYDFMARLTGKKSLAEQRQARESKEAKKK